MAQVRLGRYEAREGLLPPVCMVCGAPAGVQRRVVFSHPPAWFYVAFLAGVLPYFFLTALRGRRVLVRAPLCELHKYHWLGRGFFFGILFLAYIAVGVTTLFATQLSFVDFQGLMRPERFQNFQRTVTLLGLLVGIGGAPALLLIYLGLKLTAIHPTEITANSITLDGVVAEFCEALRVERRDQATVTPAGTDA
jgi:hypothetical protein